MLRLRNDQGIIAPQGSQECLTRDVRIHSFKVISDLKCMGGKESKSAFLGKSQSYHKRAQSQSFSGLSHYQINTKQDSFSTRSKTKWPLSNVKSAFLPVFPYHHDDKLAKNYEVLDLIAKGSYGRVLKAERKADKCKVAIKVISKSHVMVDGITSIQQCKDEVAIQNYVCMDRCPFICEIHSFWQTRTMLYIVLEYLPGGELFTLWKKSGCFSENLARFFLSEIALALEFLHSKGVLYRDLKLENIMLDNNGHVKLIDFGLSKLPAEGRERTYTICGTLQYSAPEMLDGRHYDRAIDWWSFGILMHALLVGRFPLEGARDHIQMREWIHTHNYEMPHDFTDEARTTCAQLLQKNPLNRLVGIQSLQRSPFFRGSIDFQSVLHLQCQMSDFLDANDERSSINLDDVSRRVYRPAQPSHYCTSLNAIPTDEFQDF